MSQDSEQKCLISTFKQYTPCDISDSLQSLPCKITNGGYFPNLTQYSTEDNLNKKGHQSVAGPAYTVLFAPLSDPRPATKLNYIDHIPRDSVLVISLTSELQLSTAPYVTINNALYGGLMSTRAKYLGSAGSVIFGRIRDIKEHRELGHPVWSYGVGSAAAMGKVVKCVGIGVDLEINIGKSMEIIRSGEFIIADENGMVRIPKEVNVYDVLDYAKRRVEADTLVSEDIKAGAEAGPSQKKRRANL